MWKWQRKPRVYVEMEEKTTCIRDYEFKTCVQEESYIKFKENRQAETNFTPIRNYQKKHAPRPNTETREKRAYQSH